MSNSSSRPGRSAWIQQTSLPPIWLVSLTHIEQVSGAGIEMRFAACLASAMMLLLWAVGVVGDMRDQIKPMMRVRCATWSLLHTGAYRAWPVHVRYV